MSSKIHNYIKGTRIQSEKLTYEEGRKLLIGAEIIDVESYDSPEHPERDLDVIVLKLKDGRICELLEEHESEYCCPVGWFLFTVYELGICR